MCGSAINSFGGNVANLVNPKKLFKSSPGGVTEQVVNKNLSTADE